MQILDVSVLITLTESFLPIGVYFNEHGVAKCGYRWEVFNKGGRIIFEVACRNGLWGGSCDVTTSSWGYASPITRKDFKYSSLEECITSMWERLKNYVGSNSDTKVSWFGKAEREYRNFLSLKPELQIKLFKEVHFYDSLT